MQQKLHSIVVPSEVKMGANSVLVYKASFALNASNNLNLTQAYLDNLVATELQPYVSKKTGAQEKSIRIATVPGSGKVRINVPYAHYQAYSKRIKKRVGKRGTYPFERMVADKKKSILSNVSSYARRLKNGN